nr:immunoglobulin light chain junction region [Macaca mulatta]
DYYCLILYNNFWVF